MGPLDKCDPCLYLFTRSEDLDTPTKPPIIRLIQWSDNNWDNNFPCRLEDLNIFAKTNPLSHPEYLHHHKLNLKSLTFQLVTICEVCLLKAKINCLKKIFKWKEFN